MERIDGYAQAWRAVMKFKVSEKGKVVGRIDDIPVKIEIEPKEVAEDVKRD